MSRVTNPIVIYQANEAVALNGSYIETGTYNGEVIYGCDESTIRNVAKKYSQQLGSHYFMLTNVGEDYTYSHSFLVKLISFISSLCVLVLLLDIKSETMQINITTAIFSKRLTEINLLCLS